MIRPFYVCVVPLYYRPNINRLSSTPDTVTSPRQGPNNHTPDPIGSDQPTPDPTGSAQPTPDPISSAQYEDVNGDLHQGPNVYWEITDNRETEYEEPDPTDDLGTYLHIPVASNRQHEVTYANQPNQQDYVNMPRERTNTAQTTREDAAQYEMTAVREYPASSPYTALGQIATTHS